MSAIPSRNVACQEGSDRAETAGLHPSAFKLIYADIIGQQGTTTRQLFSHPPPGYRFTTRTKLTNLAAEAIRAIGPARSFKRQLHRLLPLNLAASCCVTRFQRPPAGACLTYSESTVIFRNEPWVLWLESAIQLAGFHHHNLRRFRGLLERALDSPNCRGILCHSHAALQSMLRHFAARGFAHKMEVMAPGWQVTPFRPQDSSRPPLRILFVGGSTMNFGFSFKGGRECLEAFAALRAIHPSATLTVRSDVEPELLRRYAGLPGLRILDQPVSAEDLARLFRESDIYWYPAHSLMSVSMLEAMNYGLPVITTDYADNPEYVEDGRTGFVLPHRNDLPAFDSSESEVRRAIASPDARLVRSLVASTSCLIEQPALCRAMGRAARAALETRFSLEVKNRKLKHFLDRATSL